MQPKYHKQQDLERNVKGVDVLQGAEAQTLNTCLGIALPSRIPEEKTRPPLVTRIASTAGRSVVCVSVLLEVKAHSDLMPWSHLIFLHSRGETEDSHHFQH